MKVVFISMLLFTIMFGTFIIEIGTAESVKEKEEGTIEGDIKQHVNRQMCAYPLCGPYCKLI